VGEASPESRAEVIADMSDAQSRAEVRSQDGQEVGYLVGAILKGATDGWSLESSLDELAALADTAGVLVAGRASQRLDRPVPATYIGPGKVEEVKLAAIEAGAEVVLFDHELSPRQQRNLERELDLKVIDRTALILDVFAQHAHTREGMLQVELAQYEYRLPRLTRLWTHLARQAGGRAGGTTGGVGVRGPGETQLEIDRREIRRRIAVLKDEIEDLRGRRRQSRRQRQRAGIPVVALVGYTNAGKSTLLNTLTGTHVYTADQLFATLDPTTRRLELPSGREVLLTDTVGFIQKLPTQLVAAFRATLEEITEADLLLHVIDITHPDAVLQAETVEQVLAELGMADPPMVVTANKVDRLAGVVDEAPPGAFDPDRAAHELAPESAGDRSEPLAQMRDLYDDLVPVSARTGAGLPELLAALDTELQAQLIPVQAIIPYAAGDVLHLVHTHGVVDAEDFDEAGAHITARVPPYLLGSLAEYVEPVGR
jgi:GTP-binding protein HflX